MNLVISCRNILGMFKARFYWKVFEYSSSFGGSVLYLYSSFYGKFRTSPNPKVLSEGGPIVSVVLASRLSKVR